MMKRFVLLLLSMLMCFSMVACGPAEKEGELDGDVSKLTGEVKFLLPGSKPNDADAVVAAINAKLKADGRNYTVNFQYENWGDYWAKISLRANEGFDAAWMHANNISGFYGQKVVKSLDEYIAAYGKTLTETTPATYWDTAKIAGKTYTIPRVAPLSESYAPMAVRGDWMREFGIEKIETLAEFDNYLAKADTKLKGTTNAYVLDKDHSEFLRREYSKNFYFPLGSFSCHPVYIDLSQKIEGKYKVQSYYESDSFKSTVTKANEYYVKGYKNPSRTALESNLIDANFNNGLLGAVWSAPMKTTERIDEFKAKNPTGEIADVVLNPTDTKWILNGENSICVFSKSVKAAHVVDFLGWLRKDRANFDLLAYGIKDVNYKLTENGRLDFTGISDSKNYSVGFPSFAFSTVDNVRYSSTVSDEQVEWITNWDKGTNIKSSPLLGFAPEFKGAFNTAYSQVSAVEKSYSEDFMYGVNSITSTKYTEFISQLKANNLDRVITELQKQIDAFCAANNI